MNRKWLQGILFIAVFGIWSLVIYRFVGTNENENFAYTLPIVSLGNKNKEIVSELKLSLDYDDPFLKHEVQSDRTAPDRVAGQTRRPSPIPQTQTITAFVWPDLIYNGLIKNRQTSIEHGLITINKSNRIVHSGDMIEGLVVMRLTKNEIVLRAKNGEQKLWLAQ
jgi:hypothetical protein